MIKICLTFLAISISTISNGQKKEVLTGTAIIILGTKDSLWIAADTKVAIADGQTVTSLKIRNCKIHITKGVISTFAGVTRAVDGKFDLVDLFQKSLLRTNEIGKALNSFDTAVVDFLTNNIGTSLKLKHVVNTTGITKETRFVPILSCAFVQYIDGKRKVFFDNFFYIRDSIGKLLTVSSKGIDSKENLLYFLGHTADVRAFLDANPGYLNLPGGISNKLVTLIGVQAEKSPDLVSKPIDVIVSTRNKNSWMLKSGACQ